MKKYSIIIISLVFVFLLSGCSLSSQTNKNTPVSERNRDFSAIAEKGSLWKTSDSGKTFSVMSQIDEKTIISSADILSIAYHSRKPGNIYVGSVDNGIFKTDSSGETWEPIAFPPKRIYSFVIDRDDPDNRMFASGVVGEWGKIFRTDDEGKNWEAVYTEPGRKTVVTALSQHDRLPSVFFAGTSAGTVVKSIDRGDTWKNIGSKIDGTVAGFAFDAKENLQTYLIMFGKKIYYSPDGGNAWIDWEEAKAEEIKVLEDKAVAALRDKQGAEAERWRKKAQELKERNKTNKMPAGIISVATDPVIPKLVYVGTQAGLFKSTDNGKYWYEVNIIESAKKFSIHAIAVNPKNSNEIVFVSGKAFYKSLDSGETWSVTGINGDREVFRVSYDPFDSKYLFIGLRKFGEKK